MMEAYMAFLTADVLENPGGELPYKVVIKQGETVLGEWPVESQAEGEQQLVDLIRDAVEEQGGEDDDERDDDEEDDDDKDDDDDDAGRRSPRGKRDDD
jgi:hypothetical protein